MKKYLLIWSCALLLISCGDSSRFARIDFVNRIIFSPQDMRSLIENSHSNCTFYFRQSVADVLSEENYLYYGDMYADITDYSYINGKYVPNTIREQHLIVVKSSVNPNNYFTFDFENEDGIWCLKSIKPINSLNLNTHGVE